MAVKTNFTLKLKIKGVAPISTRWLLQLKM